MMATELDAWYWHRLIRRTCTASGNQHIDAANQLVSERRRRSSLNRALLPRLCSRDIMAIIRTDCRISSTRDASRL